MLGPVVAELAASRPGLKVGKVNVDDEPELAARHGVTSIPAVFLYRHGQVASQTLGYMSGQELAAALGLS